ncbi:MAG: HAMP domain-containing protein [Steroidobacteraceae bacterium]|nr:HAMP domain-containing protein [Deltaproteobacteria bacterium]
MKSSINIKLTAGFGLCVLLMVAVVGFNVSALRKLDKLYQEALKRTGDMELATDAQHIGEDLYQIIGNAVINRDMAKSERLWSASKKVNLAKLQKVAEIADSPEEFAMIREAQQALADILRVYEQEMLPLIMSGEAVHGPLADIDARLDERIDAIELVLQRFARSISDENRAASEEYHHVLTNTIRSGLAISLIGVIASLAVSSLTTRRIVRPLSEITRATLEMKKGNYLVELNYQSADELGVLADNFREMSGQVEKRTAELQESNEHLQREIGERKLAEEEVRLLNVDLEQRVTERTTELRNLSRHLQTVREEERTIISRDIHDDLGQLLTALKIDLLWLRSKLPRGCSQLFDKTREMEEHFDEAVRKVRRISADLRPVILDDLGLTEAIEWHAQEFQKRTGIICEFCSDFDGSTLDLSRSTALFRIIQESLTNICRHAEATRIEITLAERGDELVATVADNGKGITEQHLSDPLSFGLIGMRERALCLEGKVNISRLPDGGTGVEVIIPLDGSKKGAIA